MRSASEKVQSNISAWTTVLVGMIIIVLTSPFNIFSETVGQTQSIGADSTSVDSPKFPLRPSKPVRPERRHTSPVTVLPDSYPIGRPIDRPSIVVVDSLSALGDSITVLPVDSLAIINAPGMALVTDSLAGGLKDTKFTFNPDPTRAVWMSALFPGLGQLYNRRYWKLPIVVGAFMGLGYATNWNNTMLRDYTRAYSDIMDNDPSTNSYMDFFAPTVQESDLDKKWLTNLLRTRKNYYRRNRDLCIICMVGVYVLAMVDAYVDAQLAHFDISPDLSVDIAPTLMPSDTRGRLSPPSVGLYWALNF